MAPCASSLSPLSSSLLSLLRSSPTFFLPRPPPSPQALPVPAYALAHFKEALRSCEDAFLASPILLQIAQAYLILKRPDLALQILEERKSLLAESPDPSIASAALL